MSDADRTVRPVRGDDRPGTRVLGWGVRGTRCLLFAVVLVLQFAPSLLAEDVPSPKDTIVESLRLRESDPAAVRRFMRFGGLAIVVGLGLWGAHWVYQRLTQAQRRTRPSRGRRPSRAPRHVERTLATLGLDASERGFITRIARHQGLDPNRLVNHRTTFEQAIESSRDLIHEDPDQEIVLRAVRDKLGWTGAPGTEAAPTVPLRVDRTGQFEIELNQELDVFGTGEATGYCARAVLIYRDDHHLVLRFHEEIDGAVWKAGAVAQIYFWRANDAGYLVRARIQEYRTQSPGFLVLSQPESVERQQKRIYVRVPAEDTIRFVHLPLAEVGALLGYENRVGGLYDGVLEDLSAGGFRLTTDQELRPGDYLVIPDFPPADGAEVMVRVVTELPPGDDGRPRYGVQYIGVSAVTRDLVSRAVFARQRASIARRTGEAKPAAPVGARAPMRQESRDDDVLTIAEELERALPESREEAATQDFGPSPEELELEAETLLSGGDAPDRSGDSADFDSGASGDVDADASAVAAAIASDLAASPQSADAPEEPVTEESLDAGASAEALEAETVPDSASPQVDAALDAMAAEAEEDAIDSAISADAMDERSASGDSEANEELERDPSRSENS